MKHWTKEEVNFLKNNYRDMTDEEISKRLNRTAEAVRSKRKNMNLSKITRYKKEEDDFILKNYQRMTDEEIGKRLNRTERQIRNRRALLGLHVDKNEDLEKEVSIMYWKGYSDDYIARTLNIKKHAVVYRRLKLGLKRKRGGGEKEESLYALYENDNYVIDGTIEEIADFLNLSPATVRDYQYSDKGRELVRIG